MQNFGGMTSSVNVQIALSLVWFFKALTCFQTLFKSQQWRATSTSWSTSCPSSLRPSWTSMTSKIPQADVVVVALECFSALLRTVWALHCTAVRPGGTECLLKDVDWELCDSDLIQQTLTFKIQTPTWSPTWCTAPDRTETTQTQLAECVFDTGCCWTAACYFLSSDINLCNVFCSAWYTNGDYLVLIVTVSIILPLSLLKNLGK